MCRGVRFDEEDGNRIWRVGRRAGSIARVARSDRGLGPHQLGELVRPQRHSSIVSDGRGRRLWMSSRSRLRPASPLNPDAT